MHVFSRTCTCPAAGGASSVSSRCDLLGAFSMLVHGIIALCLLIACSVYHAICMLHAILRSHIGRFGGARPSSSRGKLSLRHLCAGLFACCYLFDCRSCLSIGLSPLYHTPMYLALTNALISDLIPGRPRRNLFYLAVVLGMVKTELLRR